LTPAKGKKREDEANLLTKSTEDLNEVDLFSATLFDELLMETRFGQVGLLKWDFYRWHTPSSSSKLA